MNLKVIEKSRKLLIQVMGQDNYEKFIEDGKIEIIHDDIKYELTEDARVYNRTKNQSYCIEPICSDNLPIHDQLAIKYGYLKHKIKRVEEVANKRNLDNNYEQLNRRPSPPPRTRTIPQRATYSDYIDYMEGIGWRRHQVCLEETSTNMVTLYNAEAHVITKIIDIMCPRNQKISIMGTRQLDENHYAHILKVHITDSNSNEIPFDTRLRMVKEKTSDETIQLMKCYYGDINLTRNIENEDRKVYKTDLEFFRFDYGIELSNQERLEIYVFDCEKEISARNIKFQLECDLWCN